MVHIGMDRSAGVILVKDVDGKPYVLCLKIYQSFDFPKGQIENDESDLQAALRETSEEASITDIKFPWGLQTVSLLNRGKRRKEVTLFLGSTEQEPKVQKNPHSGKYEHHGVEWLSLDSAEKRLHPYLRPSIAWVRQQLMPKTG